MAINEYSMQWASTIPIKVYFGTAVPTAGTYGTGDFIINTAPTATTPYAWVCVSGGTTGGTWQALYTKPKAVVYGTAAPSTGTWVQGDICWNSTPSAAGAPGWVCTTGGTSGTWKAMASLAS